MATAAELAAVHELYRSGRLEAVIEAAAAILSRDPSALPLLSLVGVAHGRLGRFGQASDAFSRVVEARPEDAAGWYNLGKALVGQERLDEAEAAFRRCVTIRPDYVDAHNNLGNALFERSALDGGGSASCRLLLSEALDCYRAALAVDPRHVDARVNLGNALLALDRGVEAEAVYREALVDAPGRAEILFQLSSLHLQRGEFAEGWPLYEWRKRKDRPSGLRRYPQPEWLGDGDIAGKALFLHGEQGLGDMIQFMRYAPLARDRGADVTLAVQKPLLDLLAGSIAGVDIIAHDAQPERFDCHAPLMSLPLAFGTGLASIPPPVPLRADPRRMGLWRERMGSEGFRIGICWQGSKSMADRGRSFPVAHFAAIARFPGIRLISLHKGAGEGQLADLPDGMRVEVPAPDLDSDGKAFVDTAAVASLCDLIITSDTSIAHIAGSLGLPTWLILPRVANWRWLADRADSPWYPTMRIFRQPRLGDWPGVFREVERALRAHVAGRC